MKYKGIELKEVTEPQTFSQPHKMLCWNNGGNPISEYVIAIVKRSDDTLFITDHSIWQHGAEIPEEPEQRRATNREIAKWLAQGNGQMLNVRGGVTPISSSWAYFGDDDSFIKEDYRVRKWDDTEWQEPTTAYLGLE